MADQRKEGKKLIGFWADPEEADLLKYAAKAAGFKTVADYLRWVAEAQPRPGQMPTDEERKDKE